MESGLVSIIVPCYNVEKFLYRFIDSIMKQSYDKIEIIFVNDGSNDDTEKIILDSKSKFLAKKYFFKYISQENKGLGGAINAGLKVFEGEYLCWADPDDILIEDSIKKRVDFLKNNKKYAVVSSDASVFNSNDLENSIGNVSMWSEDEYNENQFFLLLKRKSIFCSGCHMIRSINFLEVNPDREIYPARRGQNWQLLLPVYYKYNRGYIDEPLYKYIIYKNSMSHDDSSMNDYIVRFNEYEKIVFATLEKMKMPINERNNAKKIFKAVNERSKFHIAIEYKNILLGIKQLLKMCKNRSIKKYDFFDFYSLLKSKF